MPTRDGRIRVRSTACKQISKGSGIVKGTESESFSSKDSGMVKGTESTALSSVSAGAVITALVHKITVLQ